MKLIGAVVLLAFYYFEVTQPRNVAFADGKHNITASEDLKFNTSKSVKPRLKNILRRTAGDVEALPVSQSTVESYYAPYWQSGEWVFLRTTSKPRQRKDRQKKYKYEPLSPTPPPELPAAGNEMEVYRDCNRDCIRAFYYRYGRVCGVKYNSKTWQLEHMEFENMCELEQENCKQPHKMWQALHRGGCPELSKLSSIPTSPHGKGGEKGLIDNARDYIKNIVDHPLSELKKRDDKRSEEDDSDE